jgi:UDP-N-acetylmuramate: L-alanyl-gamma-D-glutamyl-meso-diaminopimelate ligase
VHIHILGICGTFMGSMALLARALGHKVTGSDANVYPPMSTQLQEQGIALMQGYKAEHLQDTKPDLVVIGNALSRGNEAVEYVLDKGLAYTSGAQWLKENVLKDKWVLAVAGTHGKTTTASMLAWILEYANMAPGYLIGGIPADFSVSARLGETPFFVIEADEYDTAFFDKRSKFVHYMPRTAIINNIEFDHADIFDDLAAIQRQFHHLVRTVPSSGQIIYNADQSSIVQVLDMGCWSECVSGGDITQAITPQTNTAVVGRAKDHWRFELLSADGAHFALYLNGKVVGEIRWSLTGKHNIFNGMMAIIAARHVGVEVQQAIAALQIFHGVKRRMELIADLPGVKVYDDFAHHPTAIATTLDGLRKSVGKERVIAIIEPRSNTMRLGCHTQKLAASVENADLAIWYQPKGLDWQLDKLFANQQSNKVEQDIDALITSVISETKNNDNTHIVIMSNGGFEGVHQKLVDELKSIKQPSE